jgi:hypothetical protein
MRKLLMCGVATLLAAAATVALAQRTFPQNAVRGELKAYEYPDMRIGSKDLRLTPGTRIYNEHNLIVMPASLASRKAPLMYTLDFSGNLGEIWLLSAEEARSIPLKDGTPPPAPVIRR